MTPILETKRLILRPITIEDAPAYQRHFNNWNVIQHMGSVPWPYPDDGALGFIETSMLPRMDRGEAHIWAITLKGTDELIGVMEFRTQANEDGHRGFWLAEQYWGQGLMSEAVAVVNDFVFDVLGYEELIETNAENNAASRALKKIGQAQLIEKIKKTTSDGRKCVSEVWRIRRSS